MKSIIICLMAIGGSIECASQNKMKEISVGGMRIQWEVKDDHVQFEVFAPTRGWTALGSNTQNNIVHTNLIMGAVENGIARIEDQFVTGIGKHPPITSLGGKSAITNTSCVEDEKGTAIKFSIPVTPIDNHHYLLSQGSKIWFVCAYSLEDDFQHHSIMRQHVEVIL